MGTEGLPSAAELAELNLGVLGSLFVFTGLLFAFLDRAGGGWLARLERAEYARRIGWVIIGNAGCGLLGLIASIARWCWDGEVVANIAVGVTGCCVVLFGVLVLVFVVGQVLGMVDGK
jgi:hypothetical protein